MTTIDSFIACNRFGLGARPGDLAKITDPKAWLKSQIENAEIPGAVKNFGAEGRKATHDAIQMKKEMKKDKSNEKPGKGSGNIIKRLYADHTAARTYIHVTTQQPFIERLVMFWSNHFTISVQRGQISALVNAFEVEAIRPHVTGRFADMLLASTKHPAMLMYLDNQISIGPNSFAGKRLEKGLNENLGREVMELHTLGVNGGYTQTDVTNFAKILTGWSINPATQDYQFQDKRHEPGPKKIMGKAYAESGEKEGIDALNFFASHPATAKHIATKLARHFIADNPPQEAIDTLTKVFQKTNGDLKELSLALIDLDAAWSNPLAKYKTPYEFLVSSYRLTQTQPKPPVIINALASMNYRAFDAASPAGYADTEIFWISSDAVVKRIEWAKSFSQKTKIDMNPIQLADQAFGPVMREETRFIITGAASGQDGLAFLLSSPEFQRR